MQFIEFVWDDLNEAKVRAHGVEPDDVDEILDNRFAVFRNKRGMRGAYQLVGRDSHGRYTTVIIEGAGHGGSWRPVTAWRSKPGELTKAQRQGV